MPSLYHLVPGRACGWLIIAALVVLPQAAIGQDWQHDIKFALAIAQTDAAEPADVDMAPCQDSVDDACAKCTCRCHRCCHRYRYDCCRPSLSDELTCRLTAIAKSMAAQGVVYDVAATQFYQGVTSGGQEQEFEYGGKVDQFLILDSDKLGLWRGMTMTMHVETRFGQDVNFDAVGLAPANVAMLYPKFNEHDTAITGLSFAQALDRETQLTFGKFNALDLFYSLYPQTGRGIDGFMNASMVVPISVARVAPLSFLGAGVLKYREKQIQGGVLVYDTNNSSTTSGFDDLFDNGANILGFWRFFTDVGGLPGSHFFGGIWSTGEFTSLDPAGFVIVPDEGIVATDESGAYTLLYILEQTVWMDCCNKDRNIALLSQWGLADEETSPFNWSGNIAVQAQGFNRSRPQDTFGIGYFYTGLSDELQGLLSPVLDLHDVYGAELYYNAALSNCFHLTTDLQVIGPADETKDTAVVLGLRGTLGL
jgi:porin